jgi:uncharacterized protein (AIM24 family)
VIQDEVDTKWYGGRACISGWSAVLHKLSGLGVVVHSYNPSPLEAETERSEFQVDSGYIGRPSLK